MTVVCQALKDELVRLGVPADRIRVILHGVDLQLFQPPADRVALRDMTWAWSGPTLISVGHLIDRKGHDIRHTRHAGPAGPHAADRRRRPARGGVAATGVRAGPRRTRPVPGPRGSGAAAGLDGRRRRAGELQRPRGHCQRADRGDGLRHAGRRDRGLGLAGSSDDACCRRADSPTAPASALAEGVRTLQANPPDRAATRRHAETFAWERTAAQHLRAIQDTLAA